MMRKKSRLRRWSIVGGMFAAFASFPPTAAANDNPLAHEARVRSKPVVKVAAGHWGAVDARDIRIFLEAVANEFLAYVDDDTRAVPLKIRVVPRGGSPRVLYERGRDGEYVVHLTARDENWFQYAYQFSHELCHIVSHFDHKERHGDEVVSGNQWFEESLCETAALYTLKRLAATWADAPAARQWAGYGPLFASYAEFLQAQPHRQPATSQGMGQWYRDNRVALEADPYLRESNERVATALLPLFEHAPGSWRAITHLNADSASAAKGFADFLGDWYLACPVAEREVVRQTMELFGFTPPAPSVPRLAKLADEAGK
jgi:hypothetical protein